MPGLRLVLLPLHLGLLALRPSRDPQHDGAVVPTADAGWYGRTASAAAPDYLLMSLPAQLRTPKIGSKWIWRVDSPHARSLVEIADVRWNGEEWWVYLRVLSVDLPIAEREPDETAAVYPNELDTFWEACTPVGGRVEDLSEEAFRVAAR